jgi:hypothetical protein
MNVKLIDITFVVLFVNTLDTDEISLRSIVVHWNITECCTNSSIKYEYQLYCHVQFRMLTENNNRFDEVRR